MWRSIATISKGIFAGVGKQEIHKMDVFDLVKQANGHILYLDPPYPGTLSYEKSNAVLDQVLFGASKSEIVSPFTENLDPLFDLLNQSKHIPGWMVSLNNKVVSEAELSEVIQKIDPDRKVVSWSKNYHHLSHVSNNDTNQEMLVLAMNLKK